MSTLRGVDFYNKFGDPFKKKFINSLVIWDVPAELEIGFIPKRIYCHPLLIKPLEQAFKNLIERGCVNELKSWDGCWNLRTIRGYEKKYEALIAAGKFLEALVYLSIHCWACAIDVNAAENGLGKKPKLSAKFVKCFTDAGFEWGGNWKRPDGMHFQLLKLN
jgi:hypothetical protein